MDDEFKTIEFQFDIDILDRLVPKTDEHLKYLLLFLQLEIPMPNEVRMTMTLHMFASMLYSIGYRINHISGDEEYSRQNLKTIQDFLVLGYGDALAIFNKKEKS